MLHLPQLVLDLALILSAAAVVTLIFKRLKQPLVLGYIIAGLFVSPNLHITPSITDIHTIEVWAEIGVIFLLFSLGLEFSFKKLMKVGGSSSITAGVQITCMIILGFLAGKMLGWQTMDCLFLGAALSMSSTTIIIRAFDELGVKGKKFASIVFGALVVEDIVAILLLVLLSTVAVTRQFAGVEMLLSVVKLGFFLVLWFVVGIFLLPSLLRRTRRFMNDEMLLITSLALCLVMVVLATKVGFSPALGAFVMGSILAETTVGNKIEHLTQGVKELFGAIFFVSVGMLIQPEMLVKYLWPILLITLVTIVGKTLSTMMGALISGQPLKTSVQSGMSLAQIGEFSFIIASLGASLKVTSSFLYPITVAVSAITTFTTPFMIRASAPAYEWLERTLPSKWLAAIQHYSTGAQAIGSVSDWRILLRTLILKLAIYSVIIFGVILLVDKIVLPMLSPEGERLWVDALVALFTMAILAPFFYALAVRRIRSVAALRLWVDNRYKGPLIMLQLLRIAIALFFIGYLISTVLSTRYAIAGFVLVLLALILVRNRLHRMTEWLEDRFLSNLYEKETLERQHTRSDLAPWDAHIASFYINADYNGIGKTLEELRLRELLGINISMLKRGTKTIHVPNRLERIYPADELYIIGTDDQVEAFRKYLDENTATNGNGFSDREVSLIPVEIKENNEWIGKSIKESNIRERTKGLIVGIERNGERMLNPDSSFVIALGDVVWIAGNEKRIKLLTR